MIRYLQHNEIDFERWDYCVTTADNKVPYAVSWLLNEVCQNWSALIQDDYLVVMPIVSSTKIFQYIYPPFPLQQLGIIGKTITTSTVKAFISAIPKKFKYVEMNLNEANSRFVEMDAKELNNISLSLLPTYENLSAKFSQNVKRNIKKAQKNNFIIKQNIDPKEIVLLFKNTKGKTITDLSKKDYTVLLNIMQKAMAKEQAISVGAYQNEALHTVCFFLKSLNHLIYLKGASDEIGKQFGAMHLLMQHIIETNAQKELVMNFAGANILSLARFYRSFGAIDSVYLQITINNLPKTISWLKK